MVLGFKVRSRLSVMGVGCSRRIECFGGFVNFD